VEEYIQLEWRWQHMQQLLPLLRLTHSLFTYIHKMVSTYCELILNFVMDYYFQDN